MIFHDKRHPQEMGGREIEEFLTHLTVEENLATSSQNQALNAILFLYKNVNSAIALKLVSVAPLNVLIAHIAKNQSI
ncbi:MAG: phage integrase N-terminal SAM-like domain-containing protein [Waterburya sp.]